MTFPTDPGWRDPQRPPYPGPQYPGPQYPGPQYPAQPYPGQPYAGYPYGWGATGYGPLPRNGAGTAALTLGIIALCTFWIPLLYLVGAVPCAVIAIVQGSKGRRLAAAGWATNDGKAKAGIVCGTIALVLCALNFAVGIWLGTQLS